MVTLEPAIRYGLAGRDRRLLPDDEYVGRTLALRDAVAASDLEALAIFGHPAAGGAFVYVAGYVPTMGSSAVVVTADDDPVLVSLSGPREVPFLRTQTWIADVRPSPSLLEDAVAGVAAAVAERLDAGARIGVVGGEANLDARSHARLHQALHDYDLVDGTRVVDPLRRRKRPRELAVLAQAVALATRSAAAASAASDGRSAVVAAQRHGRAGGAHDVRVLVRGDGAFLPPGARALVDVGPHPTVYCAVELSGYWGEAIAPTLAGGALAELAARAVHGAATAPLAAAEGDYDVGGGIGTERAEAPFVATGSADAFRVGDVVALRAIAADAAAAGVFRVSDGGAEALVVVGSEQRRSNTGVRTPDQRGFMIRSCGPPFDPDCNGK